LPRTAGHRKGVEAVRRVVEAAQELGIRYVTLFGFSSENWRRPDREVSDLMGLLRFYLRSHIADLHSKNVRLRVIGDRSRLPNDVVALIEKAEKTTLANDSLDLTIALSYGARQEIVAATKYLAAEVAAGRLVPEAIDEKLFAAGLLTAELPDPDLVIRTSGEQRISNFLLWQSAYAELVFVETLWPDFAKSDLEAALTEFNRRERRYGATAETR
jgi:undecaprenyl diphosphate synthase